MNEFSHFQHSIDNLPDANPRDDSAINGEVDWRSFATDAEVYYHDQAETYEVFDDTTPNLDTDWLAESQPTGAKLGFLQKTGAILMVGAVMFTAKDRSKGTRVPGSLPGIIDISKPPKTTQPTPTIKDTTKGRPRRERGKK